MSKIKDSRLWGEGDKKIYWAKIHMPVLNSLDKDYGLHKPLLGKTIGMCIHIEAKTACLALALKNAGANIALCGSNPLSTQDDVCASLVKEGIEVFAWRGETIDEYKENLREVLRLKPDILIDDGFDLTTTLLKEFPSLKERVIGVGEETTTGVIRAKALLEEKGLPFPVVAVNNARVKFLFDNRYGTGESALASFMRNTNLLVGGKVFVISGFGWVGRGLAQKLQGMKARVIVTEVDPVKAMEAVMEGFEVMPIDDAAKIGDVFITATGNCKVIREEHFLSMKDGAILANAGHFNVEIDMEGLEKIKKEKKEVRENIMEYLLPNGRRIYVIAEGRLLNLAGGDGHPVEIMDLSFAVQYLVMLWLNKKGRNLPHSVIDVPREIEENIAKRKLESMGIKWDLLTEEQKKYLKSWEV
ncbi:MAG: adenosylhomocysteinase [Dictyoglomus sp. NZ13-RE01]|nr:MAG: adenosylhomocysteinase [Dictyoglomus sp. NZ13-RE01]